MEFTTFELFIIERQWRIQDFPEGGTNSQSGCTDLLFCNFFAENCMKMKEFGPRVPGAPLISATERVFLRIPLGNGLNKKCSGGSKRDLPVL